MLKKPMGVLDFKLERTEFQYTARDGKPTATAVMASWKYSEKPECFPTADRVRYCASSNVNSLAFLVRDDLQLWRAAKGEIIPYSIFHER